VNSFNSEIPPTFEETTGIHKDNASRITNGKASYLDGNNRTFDFDSSDKVSL